MISDEPPLQFQTSHPMLFANYSMTCLISAVHGELVLPLLCINRILFADFEQVIFAVWTLNYLNPTAHRAFLLPYLLNSKCIALAHLFSAYAPPHWELNCSSSAGYGALMLYRLLETRCNHCWLWASHCFKSFVSPCVFCKFRACFQWELINIIY